MNEWSGGGNVSLKETIEQIDKSLEEYEKNCGIPNTGANEEIEKYFNLSRTQLQKLSADECGEMAYMLAQYNFHLQKCSNTETSRRNWAEDMLKKMTISKVGDYRGYSYEERRLAAIADNEATVKLDKVRIWANMRIDKLNYLRPE